MDWIILALLTLAGILLDVFIHRIFRRIADDRILRDTPIVESETDTETKVLDTMQTAFPTIQVFRCKK